MTRPLATVKERDPAGSAAGRSGDRAHERIHNGPKSEEIDRTNGPPQDGPPKGTAVTPTIPPPLRRLPWVLAFCVGLGGMGVVFGLSAVLAWNEPLVLGRLSVPSVPEGQEEAWAPVAETLTRLPELQLAVVKKHRASLTALAAVDLVSSAVLLLGALLIRRRTAGALRLLVTGLVLSQAYAALKIVVQTWMQMDVYGALRPTLEELSRAGEVGATAAQMMLLALSATIVLLATIALAELVFYVYAHRYLRRAEVAAFLSTPA